MVEAVATVGFPICACYILYQALYKIFMKMIQEQNKRIEKLEIENKEDKKLFNKAVDAFNSSVVEFKENNREMKQIKQDVEEIKNKLK